ncbi:MAG TPA: lytic transglycosylase domain-containing protein [Acidimicrobiales bacterium]|nr:lytic transglycosylase domain-containing protein [Acidimicrobiales bacterium]
MRALGRCWTAVSDVFTGVPADPPPRAPAPATAADEDYATRLTAHLLRRPGRLVAACLATVLGPAVVAQAGSLGAHAAPESPPAGRAAGEAVPVPVPGDSASWFPVARRAAATCPGLPSAVLVAIGHVESSLGLQPGMSAAGAIGPMQFLPTTWAAYAADGDGDGLSDVMNPVDAVHGAARLLCANGGADPERLASALWNYNHSDDYVRQVMTLAAFLPVKS